MPVRVYPEFRISLKIGEHSPTGLRDVEIKRKALVGFFQTLESLQSHLIAINEVNVMQSTERVRGNYSGLGVLSTWRLSSTRESASYGAKSKDGIRKLCSQRPKSPRVDLRLLAGSRILAGVVILALPTALWSPAVAAVLAGTNPSL